MSLLSHDELRVVLGSNEVRLVRIGCRWTLRGKVCQVLVKQSYPSGTEADTPWANAVSTLVSALDMLPVRPAKARVILSSRYVRYAMIPFSQSLSDESEEMAYAQHIFAQLYGASLTSWEIRLDQPEPGQPCLASAIDSQLLQALRALFEARKIKLESVQPPLMAAYNNCSAQMQNQSGWFVLADQDDLSLGWVEHGQWRSVRSLRGGNDWLDKLPEILDREAVLNEVDAASRTVFLWAPEERRVVPPRSMQWKIQRLQPVVNENLVLGYDDRFAMAICG